MNNRKSKLLLLVICLIVLAGIMLSREVSHPVKIGIYDPEHIFDTHSDILVHSGFFSWDTKPENIQKFLEESKSLNRTPLLTVEPWQVEGIGEEAGILTDTIDGKYNHLISDICTSAAGFKQEVWIRWGHEMELNNDRYPWSGKDPQDFKKAFNHFARMCREISPNVYLIWSPAGDPGLDKYWPGETNVDAVGISVYSFDQWEIKNIGYQRSFSEIVKAKYSQVSKYKKPVVIAEMGVTGSSEKQKQWLKEAVKSLYKYPLLDTVVYFNSKDVDGVWGQKLDTPDWTINADSLTTLSLHGS